MRRFKDRKSGITVKAKNRGIAWITIRRECKIAGIKPPCFMDVIEILDKPIKSDIKWQEQARVNTL